MQKLGRNDPCHCGSGKKYKKCCLEKDELANVTHIVSRSAAESSRHADEDDEHVLDDFGPEDVAAIIDDKLPWANELYRILARHLTNRMAGRYDWSVIAQAVTLLQAYTSFEQPVTKKAGVLPAAAEYCTAALINGYDVTQAELAELYAVSVTTISKKAQEMLEFAEKHMGAIAQAYEEEEEEEELPALDHRQERIGMEQSTRKMARSMSDADSDIAGERHPQREQAMSLLDQAWQEKKPVMRIELARRALTLYPDAPDAYNIMAETETRSAEQIAEHYRRGMLAGERDLGPAYFEENRGYFWGLIETRPYMRAKAGYAEACMYLGKMKEAIRHFEELLVLNPNDNQGVRDMLAAAYLEKKQYREAAALIERYEENSASVHYDRMLIEYALNGITDKLAALYQEAKQSNTHVIPYLTGKKRPPDYAPDYIRRGDDSEAQDYAVTRSDIWTREPRLVRWLAAQG